MSKRRHVDMEAVGNGLLKELARWVPGKGWVVTASPSDPAQDAAEPAPRAADEQGRPAALSQGLEGGEVRT